MVQLVCRWTWLSQYNTSIPPSWNPYTTRTIKRNYVPPASGPAGMRLYLNNNRYSTTGAAKGNVGLSAAASRAINRNSRRFLLYS